jgi:hypothetical protein
MSLAPLLSCRDGSCVRVNPDLVVAVEPENRQEPSLSLRSGACRVSITDGKQLHVLGEADEVQGTLGLICIRLALFRSGTPILLNPSQVLAVEDQSCGEPLVTRSLVMFIMGRINDGAGHVLAPPVMVRETVQQIMEAITAANEAHARGLGQVPESCGPCFAPCGTSLCTIGTARVSGSHPPPLLGHRAGDHANAHR